jgi:hypothetical protein
MLVKNIIKTVEYGAYNNYASLIPNKILDTKAIPNSNRIMVYVNYTYTNCNNTIALWGEYDIDSIDWNSFGLEKPKLVKILHTYEALDYNNTIVYSGQAYGIDDFCNKHKINYFNSYLRIRCVD